MHQTMMNALSTMDFHGTLTAKPEAATPYRLSVFDLQDDEDGPRERKCPYDIL